MLSPSVFGGLSIRLCGAGFGCALVEGRSAPMLFGGTEAWNGAQGANERVRRMSLLLRSNEPLEVNERRLQRLCHAPALTVSLSRRERKGASERSER